MKMQIILPYFAIESLIILMVLVLFVMGQPFICPCGTVRLWYGALSGPETSQQPLDFYTISHIFHGFFFLALLLLGWKTLRPTQPVPFLWLMVAATALEVGWEIFENTPFIINRYRATGIGAGYFGDSILNSISDVLAMLFGFIVAMPVARRYGWQGALVLFIVGDALLASMLRDSVLLSAWGIFGLPDWVQAWQAGSFAHTTP